MGFILGIKGRDTHSSSSQCECTAGKPISTIRCKSCHPLTVPDSSDMYCKGPENQLIFERAFPVLKVPKDNEVVVDKKKLSTYRWFLGCRVSVDKLLVFKLLVGPCPPRRRRSLEMVLVGVEKGNEGPDSTVLKEYAPSITQPLDCLDKIMSKDHLSA